MEQVEGQPFKWKLRYKGERHSSKLLSLVIGGRRDFTQGDVVTTTNYSEVVAAVESGNFEYVPTKAEKAEEEPVVSEGVDTPEVKKKEGKK